MDKSKYEYEIGEIQLLLLRRQTIINHSQRWADNLSSKLVAIFNKIKDKEVIEELANYIYWSELDQGKVNLMNPKGVMKDVYLGITGEKLIPTKLLGVKCPACGEEVLAKSISAIKEIGSEKTKVEYREIEIARLCCNDCYKLQLEKTHRPINVLMYPNPYIHKNIKMPYQDFLLSDYWKMVRDHIKMRDGGECVLCGSVENLHVHHKNYNQRGYEYNKDLHTLCGKCHARFHGK